MRHKEQVKEAIFRGEQIADALRDYYIYRTGILANDNGRVSARRFAALP